MFAVILAGCGGTRLWPLSHPERAKPCLALVGDRTLLQRTWDRIVPGLVDAADVAVVTERRYTDLVRTQLPGLREEMLLAEPAARNTAAAVALAATALGRADDEVMLVLPADHLVADELAFRALLRRAAALAADAEGLLVTLGIAPAGPETGYGYIVAGDPIPGHDGAVAVERAEKPSTADARRLRNGSAPVAWNAGIFLWRLDVLPADSGRARRTSSPMSSRASRQVRTAWPMPTGACARPRSTARSWSLRRAGRVAMLRAAVGWSDLGSWISLRDALADRAVASAAGRTEAPGVTGSGPRTDLGSERTLVLAADRPIVTVGLRDMIVVDAGDVILVAAADASQDVKAVAELWASGGIPKE